MVHLKKDETSFSKSANNIIILKKKKKNYMTRKKILTTTTLFNSTFYKITNSGTLVFRVL